LFYSTTPFRCKTPKTWTGFLLRLRLK